MSIYYKNNAPVFWGSVPNIKWYKELVIGGDGEYNPGPITITLKQRGNISHFPPADRNFALDRILDCKQRKNYGSIEDIILVTLSISCSATSVSIIAKPINLTAGIIGNFVEGMFFTGSVTGDTAIIDIAILMKLPDVFTQASKKNWIKWSDIGSLDFTIWKDNVAGERPLDWQGFVYCIKKLGSRVVVYGENGISFLIPSGSVFGLETVYRIGLKGKHAVSGDSSKHFFVDNVGKLWKLTNSLNKLGYEEYLSKLNKSIVLSYDEERNLVYICDGNLGYIYNAESGSFGEGPENITGIGYRSGTEYVTASSAITTAPFEICTDIFDLGSRAGKTIFSVELGTDLTTNLYVSVDWRRDKAGEFMRTPWYAVSMQGRAIVVAYGREFRFRVKTTSYEYFELDYIKVNGVADAY